MRDPSDQLQCSFCGKSQRQVRSSSQLALHLDECMSLQRVTTRVLGPEVLKTTISETEGINRILNE